MSTRYLDRLLHPRSVALIGASEKPDSAGRHVMRALLAGGFAGPILPVNSRAASVSGVLSYTDVGALPLAPDLAVLCTPAAAVPALIGELGARGTRAVIVLSESFDEAAAAAGGNLRQQMLTAAKPYLLRVLGPGSLGVLVPGIGLDASLSPVAALRGRIGFVSQSGTLCSAVLDWARFNGIGFSHVISVGASVDVDVSDVLDFLASDPETRAILLYVESIGHSRKFMSAARAAARNKPVVAVKPRPLRLPPPAATADSYWLPDADEVYTAAFSRAGIVRVQGIEELFEAAETLSRARRLPGDRLAMLGNGQGPLALALDALGRGAGKLAALAPDTLSALRQLTPLPLADGAPVALPIDAPADNYRQALSLLLQDTGVDVVLALHVPGARLPAIEPAQAVIDVARTAFKTVLACWLGREQAAAARKLFAEAGLPSFETPGAALRALAHMLDYRRTQEMLLETPPETPADFSPDTAAARQIIAQVLADGRNELREAEAGALLRAYGLPVVQAAFATDIDGAVREAARLGYPVVLKIVSPDIGHRRAVGGVALDVEKPRSLVRAAEAMLARVERLQPGARIDGFTVQALARRPLAQIFALSAGIDPLFGPVICFGDGGSPQRRNDDRAIGLPPLNMALAASLIARTRAGQRLTNVMPDPADRPAGDAKAVALALVQLSQLLVEQPEIVDIDVDPLLVDADGVLARAVRVRIAQVPAGAPSRLAIRPYPQSLAESFTLRSGATVTIRPIRPEDEPAHLDFFQHLAPDDVRFRFFNLVRALPHSEMARFTQIDYDREMAFIATLPDADGKPTTLGVVRTVTGPDNERAEFAIIVRTDVKSQGLGSALLEKMIRYCRSRGTRTMVGQVLRENLPMRQLAETFGFRPHAIQGEDALEMTLDLTALPVETAVRP